MADPECVGCSLTCKHQDCHAPIEACTCGGCQQAKVDNLCAEGKGTLRDALCEAWWAGQLVGESGGWLQDDLEKAWEAWYAKRGDHLLERLRDHLLKRLRGEAEETAGETEAGA